LLLLVVVWNSFWRSLCPMQGKGGEIGAIPSYAWELMTIYAAEKSFRHHRVFGQYSHCFRIYVCLLRIREIRRKATLLSLLKYREIGQYNSFCWQICFYLFDLGERCVDDADRPQHADGVLWQEKWQNCWVE
jgi:hypothetical protein